MAAILEIDQANQQLIFEGKTALPPADWQALILKALLTMLPAEKMEMMAPPTTRGYTISHITVDDYQALSAAIQLINQHLGQEVLRTNFRPRAEGEPLQAKILLGEKSVVKGVRLH
ncbi:MAG: hypothetical protein NW237_00560 [Cyanobacteriota bacterium]|nr:hypothetical protein [Cyanobacteriota bacterium]